jgi:hypothetical protein
MNSSDEELDQQGNEGQDDPDLLWRLNQINTTPGRNNVLEVIQSVAEEEKSEEEKSETKGGKEELVTFRDILGQASNIRQLR